MLTRHRSLSNLKPLFCKISVHKGIKWTSCNCSGSFFVPMYVLVNFSAVDMYILGSVLLYCFTKYCILKISQVLLLCIMLLAYRNLTSISKGLLCNTLLSCQKLDLCVKFEFLNHIVLVYRWQRKNFWAQGRKFRKFQITRLLINECLSNIWATVYSLFHVLLLNNSHRDSSTCMHQPGHHSQQFVTW
jgi:hypothetical protein